MSEEDKKEEKVDETSGFVVSNSDMPEVKAESEGEGDEKKAEAKDKVEAKDDEGSSDNGDNGAADPEEGDKRQNGVQKRIDKLVREREEAKREAEAAKREAAELKKQQEQQSKAAEAKEPQEKDFETYDEYLDALDKFEKRQERISAKSDKDAAKDQDDAEEEKPTELTDSQKTALAIVQEAVESAEDKPDDFDKVALAEDVHITGEMLEAIAECDNPVKVMYELGKDKTLSAEIAGKSPVQQARAIAKLDLAQAETKPAKPAKTTKAPDPIEPVAGSDAQEKSPGEMSFKEFEAWRNKQESGNAKSTW